MIGETGVFKPLEYRPAFPSRSTGNDEIHAVFRHLLEYVHQELQVLSRLDCAQCHDERVAKTKLPPHSLRLDLRRRLEILSYS